MINSLIANDVKLIDDVTFVAGFVSEMVPYAINN